MPCATIQKHLSVGSVYEKQPIIDGWLSVIALNCTFELCGTVSPLHRFFERKLAMLKFLARTRIYLDMPELNGMWNAVKHQTASLLKLQAISLDAAFGCGKYPWEMGTVSPRRPWPKFTFKTSDGISLLVAKDVAGKAIVNVCTYNIIQPKHTNKKTMMIPQEYLTCHLYEPPRTRKCRNVVVWEIGDAMAL
eukprot:s880_g3.t1